MIQVALQKTPIGPITLYVKQGKVVEVKYIHEYVTYGTNFSFEVKKKVVDYFFHHHKPDLTKIPTEQSGTPFQKKVWEEIRKIPYGQVRTYKEIAEAIGSAPIAVGTACGKNRIPIIIPCHRVVSKNGLGGYSFGKGIETKKILLKLEGYLS
jgi:methylated-DNA-[protein]-cysteine S-methyltransferase